LIDAAEYRYCLNSSHRLSSVPKMELDAIEHRKIDGASPADTVLRLPRNITTGSGTPIEPNAISSWRQQRNRTHRNLVDSAIAPPPLNPDAG
jgi:hypothetical protein